MAASMLDPTLERHRARAATSPTAPSCAATTFRRDDRLRSFVDAERITADSYISIAGWAFQGLRLTDVAGMQPIALPAIDARWRIADPWLGGQFELQANSLAILRPEGQDSQRAFASARWDRRGDHRRSARSWC